MDGLRKPFFVAAAICVALVVMLESGSGFVVKPSRDVSGDSASLRRTAGAYSTDMEKMDKDDLKRLTSLEKPPGRAIPQMAVLDGLLLFTIGLMGATYVFSDRLSGKIQGIVTLILSLVVIFVAILFILRDLGQLILMLSLFLAPPFGTIAYLAIWGTFNRDAAQVVLGTAMFLKFGLCVTLVLAQQRFIQNKGLLLIIGTSLLANLVVSFLHALVPVILVSITDAIGAIVVLVLALIWAVAMLIGAIIAVIKAIF